MTSPGSFMETPLVVWVQTFKSSPMAYKDLQDGIFLNAVLRQIDPRSIADGITNTVEDTKDRLQNWDIIMRNLKLYYQDVLQQFIVMKLPNIVTISKEPESDGAKNELQKVLLLILGCAVQCERKEQFIENIKQLDLNTQHGIVEYIKEITDDTKNVFAIDIPLDQMDDVSRSMHYHLRMLIQERDGYVEELKEVNQTLEELHRRNQKLRTQGSEPTQVPQTLPSVSALSNHSPDKQEKQHLTVELSEVKAKMRKLRQELEEKTEYSIELQEELDEVKIESQRLRNENLDLTQDARAARTYRDELDILKEKASRVDKFEAEITKYKEKLNELEFFKTRVDELREDNQLLVETRNELEEQLDASHKRLATVEGLENELMRYKKEVQDFSNIRDFDRQKIAELTEQLMRLEFDKKSSFNETANLEDELQRTNKMLKSGISNSLSDQLNETANAKLLRLELENQRLLKRQEEIKDIQLADHSSKLLELEKENHRLSKKVGALQEAQSRESHDIIQLEHETDEVKHQKQQLEDTLSTVKESSQRQIKELERENVQLQETVTTLRERNEKTNDARLKDLEKDNKRLAETVKTVTATLSNVEYEKRQLQKTQERLEENVEQIKEFEEENQCLDKENEELRKNVATLERTCEKYDKLEQENSDMEVENQKLNKMVESLQKSVGAMEILEQENINLTVELQHFKRSVESLKTSSSKVADLEHKKDLQNREIQQLKKAIENSKMDKEKQEQLEVDLLELDTENQKLQRQCEGLSRKIQDIERENADLESQIGKYEKTVENMKISLKKLSELERENGDLETESNKCHRELNTMEKDNKRLRASLETKDTSIDELHSKLSIAEHELKSSRRRMEQSENTKDIIKELERENAEIVQQSVMDKKTLSTLREDFVNEKIGHQQKNNELEKLSQELEKVGLNKDKLMAAEQAQDESKYIALESMMEEAYQSTLSIKEEKIHTLQSKLDESKTRNLRLQEEMQSVKREHAALQQQFEEEVMVYKQSSPRDSNSDRSTHSTKLIMHPNATKEILELKDHIIQLERLNATLEAENRNFISQREDLQDQLAKAFSQHNRLQSQLTSVQEHNYNLQSQNANMQVENKTLQSQGASLMSQNALLQKQHSELESEHDQLLNTHEDLQSAHESLQADHDALEKLHEQLSAEYEALIAEHGSLKTNYKSLRAEVKELQDQNMMLQREKKTVAEVRESLEKDKEDMKLESRSHSALQLDYVRLKEEIMRLQNSKERSEREHRDLTADHKTLKTEYNTLKSKYNDLKSTFDECRKQLNGMEVEVNKLANKCENLAQLNTKLEEENRNLMMQLQALLNQNQELLTHSLDSKDQLHEEQKTHLEKLNSLRRQKEKLEEKIMEQYKRYDPVKKKNRGFGANLVKKARALVGKGDKPDKQREREKRSKSLGPGDFSLYVHGESPGENSSVGSGSHDNTDNSNNKNKNKKTPRRGSEGSFLDDSPTLSLSSKAFAKSTTALNYSKHDPDGSFLQGMRGAQSDDNLLDSPQKRRPGDGLSPMARHQYDTSRHTGAAGGDGWSPSTRRSGHGDGWSPSATSRRGENNGWSPMVRRSDGSPASKISGGDANNSEWPTRAGDRRVLMDTSTSTSRSRMSVASDNTGEEDERELTLEEFLNECDKSPKSRRKWLVENRVDLDIEKDKKGKKLPEPITQLLSPTMGPRSPTVEEAANKSLLMSQQRSKSEMNISKLTTFSMMSNIEPGQHTRGLRDRHAESFTSPRGPSHNNQAGAFSTNTWSTSTPKYSRSETRSGPQSQQPGRGATPGGPGHRVNGGGDYAEQHGPSPLRSRSVIMEGEHTMADNRQLPHQPPPLPRQGSGSSVGSGGYNATTRQTTGSGGGSAFSPPTHSNGGSPSMSGSHTLPRQSSLQHHRRETSNDSSERGFVSTAGGGNSFNTPGVQRSRTPSAKDSRHLGPSPMKASYIPPDHAQHSSADMSQSNVSLASTNTTDQYNPGNVRSLVQTYQKNVHTGQYNHQAQPSANQNPPHPSPPSSNYNQTSSNNNQSSGGGGYNQPQPQTYSSSNQGSTIDNHTGSYNHQPPPPSSHFSSPKTPQSHGPSGSYIPSYNQQNQQSPPQSNTNNNTSYGGTNNNNKMPAFQTSPTSSSSGYHHNQPVSSSGSYPQPHNQPVSSSGSYPQPHNQPVSSSGSYPQPHNQPVSSPGSFPQQQHPPYTQPPQYNKYQPGPSPHDPVAPPRRTRPMSAGPLVSSNKSAFSAPIPTGGSTGSAFTAPIPSRSYTPTASQLHPNQHPAPQHPDERSDRGMSLPPSMLNRGRSLPSRPDEQHSQPPPPQRVLTQPHRLSMNGPPGGPTGGRPDQPPPPPPPHEGPPHEGEPGNPGEGPDGKIKNSKWYEYGCV